MSGITIPGDYDDWRWAGSGVNPPGAPTPAVLEQIETDWWAWTFVNGQVLTCPDHQMPHDYKEGTDIVPHIHWCPSTTATYTGTWTLVMSYWTSAATGTARSTFTTTAAFNASMTQYQMQSQDFASVLSNANMKISMCADVTLKLALTAGTKCILKGFDGHYLKDRLGSRQITSKT
jgi:hypothetical protein